mgnify:CR=1 FL=1
MSNGVWMQPLLGVSELVKCKTLRMRPACNWETILSFEGRFKSVLNSVHGDEMLTTLFPKAYYLFPKSILPILEKHTTYLKKARFGMNNWLS